MYFGPDSVRQAAQQVERYRDMTTSVLFYCAIQYNTIQYNTIQNHTIQYNATLHCTPLHSIHSHTINSPRQTDFTLSPLVNAGGYTNPKGEEEKAFLIEFTERAMTHWSVSRPASSSKDDANTTILLPSLSTPYV